MGGNSKKVLMFPLLGLFLFALWLLSPLQARALTPAGTVIGNVATATYYDEDNNKYTTTSNLVQTTVQEVCGVDVAGGGNKEGVPGQTVYIPFTVTNKGNGENTFNLSVVNDDNTAYTKQIYLDENQNGVVDPGESTVSSVTLGMGETANIVVAVKVPTDARNGDANNFSLKAEGTAPGGCSDLQTATVTVVADALIQANKSVDKDSAQPGDTLTYTISFKNVGTKPAKAVTVKIDGQDKEGILVYDQIPTGATYKSGSASGEPSGGQVVYSTDGTNWTTTEPSDVRYIGFFIPDSNPTDGTKGEVLDPDQQGTLTFQVIVNSPFDDPDGEVNNTAKVKYTLSDGTTEKEVTTNEATTKIPPESLADIAVSQKVNSASDVEEDSNNNWQDDNTKNNVPAGSWVEFDHSAANKSAVINDVVELQVDTNNTNLPSGAIVEFWNADGTAKLIDTDGDGKVDLGTLAPGEKKDFKVKVFIPANAPNGNYYVTVLASSGTNPNEVDRSRDNINGIISASVDIGKKGTLLDDKNDPSDGNTDGTNDSDDVLPSDNGSNGVVDIVDPGQTAVYPLEIANTGSSPDQFNLSATGNPAGTTVKFYTDPNCDGNYSDGEQITETPLMGGTVLSANASAGSNTLHVYSVASISAGDKLIVDADTSNAEEVEVQSVDVNNNTITLTSNLTKDHTAGARVAEKVCVVMAVETTSSTPPGENNVVISATSQNSGASDNMDAYLKVNPVCQVAISPEHSDQLPPGGTTTYQHTVVNNGNTNASVTITVPSSNTQLSYVILDSSKNPQGTSYTVNLAPGASQTFYVKVVAPSNISSGTVESIDVTASADIDGDGNADCSNSVTDTTTIIEGYLQLTKSATTEDTGSPAADGSCTNNPDNINPGPCDTITYEIKYKNIGEKDALNVVITDQIPDHTEFIPDAFGTGKGLCYDSNCDGDCDDQNDVKYTNASGDDAAEYDSVNNLVRFRVGTGADASKGGTVAPGQEGCVIFKVRIK